MEVSATKSLAVYVLINLLRLSVCQDVVLELQRTMAREGFHRDIHTTLSIPSSDVTTTSDRVCSVLLIETLPSSLYVDTFQLDNLAQFGGPQVLTDGHVDIEAPAYQSKELELYVYVGLPLDSHQSSPVTVTVYLPIHVRYHQPSSDPKVTHVPVIMYHPRVLLNCSKKNSRLTEAPCDAQNTTRCPWAELPYKSDTHMLELAVPVGREEDVRVVVYGTIIVTVMGCTFLLYVIAFYDQWKVKVKER